MTGPSPLALAAALAGLGAAMAVGELRALYHRCASRALAVALHLLRDRAEAEDVVQETFLELWRGSSRFDPARGSRDTWALLVARSRALDRLRARGSALRSADRAGDDPAAEPAAPAELVEERQRAQRVRRALAALPRPQREAIELAFFRGLSHLEIAAATGEPLGTVKTRVRLAIEKLAAELGAREP